VLSFRAREPLSMPVLSASTRLQGKESQKGGGANSFAHIAKEPDTLWRSATRYTGIQAPTSKEADQRALGMPIMFSQILRRQKNLLLYLPCLV